MPSGWARADVPGASLPAPAATVALGRPTAPIIPIVLALVARDFDAAARVVGAPIARSERPVENDGRYHTLGSRIKANSAATTLAPVDRPAAGHAPTPDGPGGYRRDHGSVPGPHVRAADIR